MFNYVKGLFASAKAACVAAIVRVKAMCRTAALAAAAVCGLILVFTPAASLVVVCVGLLLVAVTVYTVIAILAAAVNAAATATATVMLWVATAADLVEAVVYGVFAFTADLVEHVRKTRRRRILAARRRFVSAWSRILAVSPVAVSPAVIAEVAPIVVAEEVAEVAPVVAFAVGADLEAARDDVRALRKAARKLAKVKADRGNRRAEMPSETRVKRDLLEGIILG